MIRTDIWRSPSLAVFSCADCVFLSWNWNVQPCVKQKKKTARKENLYFCFNSKMILQHFFCHLLWLYKFWVGTSFLIQSDPSRSATELVTNLTLHQVKLYFLSNMREYDDCNKPFFTDLLNNLLKYARMAKALSQYSQSSGWRLHGACFVNNKPFGNFNSIHSNWKQKRNKSSHFRV